MCENIGLSSQFNSSPWIWSTLGFSARFGKTSTFFRKQALSVTVAIVPFVPTNPVWKHQRSAESASATILHRLSLSLLLQSGHLRPYAGRVLLKTSRYNTSLDGGKTHVRALSLPHPGPSVNKTGSAISTLCDCAWSPVQAGAHTEINWARRCQEWNKDGIKLVPFFYPDHVCVVFDMCNGVSFGESWGCKSFWHSCLGHYTLLYFYMVCQFSRILPLKPAA